MEQFDIAQTISDNRVLIMVITIFIGCLIIGFIGNIYMTKNNKLYKIFGNKKDEEKTEEETSEENAQEDVVTSAPEVTQNVASADANAQPLPADAQTVAPTFESNENQAPVFENPVVQDPVVAQSVPEPTTIEPTDVNNINTVIPDASAAPAFDQPIATPVQETVIQPVEPQAPAQDVTAQPGVEQPSVAAEQPSVAAEQPIEGQNNNVA